MNEKFKFSLGPNILENTINDMYLGILTNSPDSLKPGINTLEAKLVKDFMSFIKPFQKSIHQSESALK